MERLVIIPDSVPRLEVRPIRGYMNTKELFQKLHDRSFENNFDEVVRVVHRNVFLQISRCSKIVSNEGVARIALSLISDNDRWTPALTLRDLVIKLDTLVPVCETETISCQLSSWRSAFNFRIERLVDAHVGATIIWIDE